LFAIVFFAKKINNKQKPFAMKISKNAAQSKPTSIPDIQFQDQKLTSFAGAVILQKFFDRIGIRKGVQDCFRHIEHKRSYNDGLIMMVLIVHLMLGFRKLQDVRYYKDDPMILRLLGVKHIPDCATISRRLASWDSQSVGNARELCRQLVLDRIAESALPRVTLDFDGSVIATGRFAEGAAVGYNKKKKGQRSYYPLFCTIAQTGQVFDVWHRPGNVHDSNGALSFILDCINSVKALNPNLIIEVRMDSAFFCESIADALHKAGVEFTMSVPFARYTELKTMIEGRKRWHQLNSDISFFETSWKPKSWGEKYRFVFIRTRAPQQHKGPIQLDLFEPYEYQHEFKVIVTNKSMGVKKILNYHNGRGYQENIFAELKTHVQLDYVPTKRLVGNQIFMLAAILSHNLHREMQMIANKTQRNTNEKRAPLWVFEKIDCFRLKFIQKAGRITKPKGKLTLTLNANESTKAGFMHFLDAMAA
jgi:hypothetical protein